MRFFLFLFLSLYIESNITERDDVKEFIKFAISNSDLDRDEVLAFIKDAKPSKKAVVLKNNAYGHGLLEIGQLVSSFITYFVTIIAIYIFIHMVEM